MEVYQNNKNKELKLMGQKLDQMIESCLNFILKTY